MPASIRFGVQVWSSGCAELEQAARLGVPLRALVGFLPFEIDLFKEEEAGFARRNQIQVAVAVDVEHGYLHAASGFASVVDDMFDESAVRLGPVPVEPE